MTVQLDCMRSPRAHVVGRKALTLTLFLKERESGGTQLNRRTTGVPVGGLLVSVRHPEQRLLGEGLAYDLQT